MIDIKVDASQIKKAQLFVAQINNQLPFATSVALNQTARDVQQALKAQTKQSFVNPVAYTVNAFRYDKSTKRDLVATVYPDKTRRYFPTEIFGGQRKVKPYEGFIRGLSNGTLPAGKLLPTAVAINAAGNPKKSLFGQIQSRLSTTDRGGFFIGTPRGGNRAPGVYRRSREKLIPYFVIGSEPRYRPLFPMEQTGNRTASRVFTSHLSIALDRAMASAR
jgi:hypothetical protein